MSVHLLKNKVTTKTIREMKGKEKIVALTAYTKNMAQLMDMYVDAIIVGDSVGMVAYGMDSTLPVTVDMMIAHGAAVVRGCQKACVIIDLPFGSYQESKEQAFGTAAKVLAETGAQAVKIEGGVEMTDTVRFLVDRGVPVMAHIGLKPQYANGDGGFKVQGKSTSSADKVLREAESLTEAGAFSLLIEGVYEHVAADITQLVDIPTIGIGASIQCDGQVLVTEDMLGLFSDYAPKFVKHYRNLGPEIMRAFEEFSNDVRLSNFPAEEHCFIARK